MKKAYDRVATTGMVYSEKSRKYNHEDPEEAEQDGNILDFLIPMGVLVALAIISGDLVMSVAAALIVCFVLYIKYRLNRVLNVVFLFFLSLFCPYVDLVSGLIEPHVTPDFHQMPAIQLLCSGVPVEDADQ